MKKQFLFYLIFLVISCRSNNESGLNYQDFYENHKNDKGIITFKMMPFLFNLFIDKRDEETIKTLDQINRINFLINENSTSDFTTELKKHLPESIYMKILTVKDGNANIEFLVNEKEELVKEIIMIVNEGKTCVVMYIQGSFDKENVKLLSEKININDLVKYRM